MVHAEGKGEKEADPQTKPQHNNEREEHGEAQVCQVAVHGETATGFFAGGGKKWWNSNYELLHTIKRKQEDRCPFNSCSAPHARPDTFERMITHLRERHKAPFSEAELTDLSKVREYGLEKGFWVCERHGTYNILKELHRATS